jgi:hypothetical protein
MRSTLRRCVIILAVTAFGCGRDEPAPIPIIVTGLEGKPLITVAVPNVDAQTAAGNEFSIADGVSAGSGLSFTGRMMNIAREQTGVFHVTMYRTGGSTSVIANSGVAHGRFKDGTVEYQVDLAAPAEAGAYRVEISHFDGKSVQPRIIANSRLTVSAAR